MQEKMQAATADKVLLLCIDTLVSPLQNVFAGDLIVYFRVNGNCIE
jgi:hypothetical protein